MRRPRPKEEPVDGCNMTPMIDIVFQLIIFFMLVLDMSRNAIEPLTLPQASEVIRVEATETTLILNITKDGTIRIQGRTFWKPGYGDDNQKVEDLFELRRLRDLHIRTHVLIRADRSTSFEHIQKVLMIASQIGEVTKIEFAARKGGE